MQQMKLAAPLVHLDIDCQRGNLTRVTSKIATSHTGQLLSDHFAQFLLQKDVKINRQEQTKFILT